MERIKVGVALSGGVDSTTTALLLKEQYTVSGFFMQLAQPDLQSQTEKVREVAAQIEIPLQIIDLRSAFEKRVLDYFSKSYFQGLTPNPCVICNQQIKFGLFLDAILANGMEQMATGHYARIISVNNEFHLYKGVDQTKDQSYFLSRLSQEQLAKTLFPLGGMKKSDIYDLAEKYGFHGFRGQESQDVCFLENMAVADFLQRRENLPIPGDIIGLDGRVLGQHTGITNYTVGQRRGLGIADSSPYYVIKLDSKTNSVVVGKEDDLYQKSIQLRNLHQITSTDLFLMDEIEVKIRSTHKGCRAKLSRIDKEKYQIIFAEPQRALTPGQFAVFYHEDEVLGSAEIV